MRKSIIYWLALSSGFYPLHAVAAKITVDGKVTVGSSMGEISNDTEGYPYARTTKNLEILIKACPVSMGDEVRCVVTFEEKNGSITKIISARRPTSSDITNSPVIQQSNNSTVSRRPQWKDAFSRRSYQLGMTISKFRATPYPDQKEWPGSYPVCSDEKSRVSSLSSSISSEISSFHLQNMGAIKCIFVYTGSSGTSTAGLMLGDVSPISNNFLFIRPKDASEPVLFEIDVEYPTAYFSSVIDSLRSYYGNIDKVSSVDLTNGIGMQIKGQVSMFANSSSTIIVRQYADNIRRGSITYTLNDVVDEVIAANKRLNQRPGPP